ncbi:MAG: tetratricopeptide repeat protein [Kiritimatiellia bacterium]
MTARLIPFLLLASILSARPAVVDFEDQDVKVVTPQNRPRTNGQAPGAKWEQKFNIAQVDLLVSTARRFFDEGNYEAAIENLMRADGELPFNPIINLAISQTCASMGDYDRAVLYGNRVITYDPRNPAGYLMLGYCYLESQNYAQAQSIYETLLDFDPAQVDALSGLAHALGSQGENDKAADTYRKALKLQPASSYLLEMLGNVLAAKGDHAGAVKTYQQALLIAPKSVEIFNSLGAARFAMGETNLAVEAFTSALQIEPRNAKIHRNLAGILTAAKNYPAALQVLMAAIDLEFNSPSAWQHMLRVYLRVLQAEEAGWTPPEPPANLATPAEQARWHHQQALSELEQKHIARGGQHLVLAILLDDQDPRYFNDFGTLVAAHLHKPYSVPFFRAAELIDPAFLPARGNLQKVLAAIDVDNRTARLQQVAQAVEKQPEDAALNYELARLLASFNQITNALPRFARAVSLAPTNTTARMDYAQALFACGRPDDAIAQVQAALELAPAEPLLQYRLAWLTLQKGAPLAPRPEEDAGPAGLRQPDHPLPRPQLPAHLGPGLRPRRQRPRRRRGRRHGHRPRGGAGTDRSGKADPRRGGPLSKTRRPQGVSAPRNRSPARKIRCNPGPVPRRIAETNPPKDSPDEKRLPIRTPVPRAPPAARRPPRGGTRQAREGRHRGRVQPRRGDDRRAG